MPAYSRQAVRCECCEGDGAFKDIHEPYTDGLLWIYVECWLCGFRRVIRDDWHPENERIIHDPGARPPPRGILGTEEP